MVKMNKFWVLICDEVHEELEGDKKCGGPIIKPLADGRVALPLYDTQEEAQKWADIHPAHPIVRLISLDEVAE